MIFGRLWEEPDNGVTNGEHRSSEHRTNGTTRRQRDSRTPAAPVRITDQTEIVPET